jgi:hypothetical protein
MQPATSGATVYALSTAAHLCCSSSVSSNGKQAQPCPNQQPLQNNHNVCSYEAQGAGRQHASGARQ